MNNEPNPQKNRLKANLYSCMNFMPEELIFDKEVGSLVRFRTMFEMPNWNGVEEGETTYIVSGIDERLDTIAKRVWGVERQELYWVIAARNNLDLPDVQLYQGRKLKIPSIGWIDTRFLPQSQAFLNK